MCIRDSQKALPAQVFLREAFLRHGRHDLHLCGNAGVVGSRLPKRVISLHPPPPDQNVLEGIVQRMAHVQLSRNIRRGNHNGIGRLILLHFCVEVSSLFPLTVQPVSYTHLVFPWISRRSQHQSGFVIRLG